MRKLIKKNIHIFNNNSGMSLVEVLIAMVLMVLIATTFLNMFMYSFDLSVESQETTNHTYSAQAVIESTRALNYRELAVTSTAREGYDSNGDGVNDCFVQRVFSPHGIEMNSTGTATTDPSDAVYLHVIYYGEDLMVVAPGGANLYFSDVASETGYSLTINSGSTVCRFTIGSNNINFNRTSTSSEVIVIVNMEQKAASYDNDFEIKDNVSNASNDAIVKVLSNPTVESTVVFTKKLPDERFLGVMNMNSSLVSVTVNMYEEIDSTIPSITMTEILEISNGLPD